MKDCSFRNCILSPACAHLFLRVYLCLFMILGHGWGKFVGLLSGGGAQFPDPLGLGSWFTFFLAVLSEFIAPIFVMVGFKIRWFCLPIIATMLVAGFVIHFNDPFFGPGGSKEFALLYAFGFLTLFLWDTEACTLDAYLSRRKGK